MNYLIENHEGMTFIAVQKTTPAQTFNASLTFKVGAGYESKALAGISHYLEHAVFLGTQKRPTRERVEEDLLSFGGDYNAYTSVNSTSYCLAGQLPELKRGVESLYELSMNALLNDEKELKKEKKVVISELEQELTEEGKWADQMQVAYETLFKGTILEQSVLGTKKTLKNIDPETLKFYHKTFYQPSRACLSVAAPFEPKETLKWITAIKPPKKPKAETFANPFTVTKDTTPLKLVKCIKTASFTWDLDFFYHFERPKHPKYLVALKILSLVLFHSEMSYVFGQARKEGLVYMAHGMFLNYLGADVYRGATNLAPNKVARFFKLFKKQIQKILNEGIDPVFWNYCTAHFSYTAQTALEKYDLYAHRLVENHFLKEDMLMPEDQLRYLPTVKPDDVVELLRIISTAPRQVITVKGPEATPEFEQELNSRGGI